MSGRDITSHLKEFHTALKNFRDDIDETVFAQARVWLEQRVKSIACVNCAIEELNEMHRKVCFATAVSSTGATLAEVGRIIGAATAGHPVGRAVKSASDVVMLTSAVSNLAAMGIECLVSNNLMKRVKTELRRDEELFNGIEVHLTHSQPLYEALRKLLGLSVLPSPKNTLSLVVLLGATIAAGYEDYALVVNTITSSSEFKNLSRIAKTKFRGMVEEVGKSEESLIVMRNISCTVQARPEPVRLLKLLFHSFKDYYFEITLACFVGVGVVGCAGILDPAGESMKWRLFQGALLVMLVFCAIQNWKAYKNNEPSQYSAALVELRDLMMKEVSSVHRFLVEAE